MKLSMLVAAAVSLTALTPAMAQEFSTTTTTVTQDTVPIFEQQVQPIFERRIQSVEVPIIEQRVQPVFITPMPQSNTIIIKQKRRHLLPGILGVHLL